MRRTFEFVASFEGEIPGAAPKDCGNYLLHDLPMAQWESRKFVDEVLTILLKTIYNIRLEKNNCLNRTSKNLFNSV